MIALNTQSFAIPLDESTLVLAIRRLPVGSDGRPRFAVNEIDSPKRIFVGPTREDAIRLLVEDRREPPILLVPAKGGA